MVFRVCVKLRKVFLTPGSNFKYLKALYIKMFLAFLVNFKKIVTV